MTQIGITGKKIATKLDKKIIRKGGLQTITLPVLKADLASEHESLKVEFGGYKSLVYYNKYREQQHRKDKFNQKIRATNRNIRNKRLRQSGLTHNIVVQTGVQGDVKS